MENEGDAEIDLASESLPTETGRPRVPAWPRRRRMDLTARGSSTTPLGRGDVPPAAMPGRSTVPSLTCPAQASQLQSWGMPRRPARRVWCTSSGEAFTDWNLSVYSYANQGGGRIVKTRRSYRIRPVGSAATG